MNLNFYYDPVFGLVYWESAANIKTNITAVPDSFSFEKHIKMIRELGIVIVKSKPQYLEYIDKIVLHPYTY